MRKTLIALLMLTFTNVVFAEKPQIVDPPRPTKEFKYLLMIEKIQENTSPLSPLYLSSEREYIYLDNYRILTNYNQDDKWLRIQGSYEAFWGPGCGNPESKCYLTRNELRPEGHETLLLSISFREGHIPGSGTSVTLKQFLIAKAPKPLESSALRPDDHFKEYQEARQLKPEKAKVIFTQK